MQSQQDESQKSGAEERRPAGMSPRTSTSDSSGELSPSVTVRSRFRCTKVEEPKLILPPDNGEYARIFRRMFMRKHCFSSVEMHACMWMFVASRSVCATKIFSYITTNPKIIFLAAHVFQYSSLFVFISTIFVWQRPFLCLFAAYHNCLVSNFEMNNVFENTSQNGCF